MNTSISPLRYDPLTSANEITDAAALDPPVLNQPPLPFKLNIDFKMID
jgi:hypothetical protein